MKKELFKCKRGASESIVSFNRRFRELAAEAYPLRYDPQGVVIPRNRDQVEALVKTYAAGLRERRLAVKIITPEWPQTLEEAMQRTAATEKQSDSLQRLGYGEEPMEVDAVSTMRPAAFDKELHLLKTQYGKLESKVDRLLERMTQPKEVRKPWRRETQQRAFPKKDTPRRRKACFYCGQEGHFEAICRKRQSDLENGIPHPRQVVAAARTAF
jgi:hypothetical protein